MTVQFTTSNAPGKYYIHDNSTDTSSAEFKRVIIRNINGVEIFNSGNITTTINPIEVNTSNWLADGALLQISVELGYPSPGSFGISVVQTYLLPTTLNIKS